MALTFVSAHDWIAQCVDTHMPMLWDEVPDIDHRGQGRHGQKRKVVITLAPIPKEH